MNIERQIECVEREIAFRQAAYPKWVEARMIEPDRASEEIEAMQAVRNTLAGRNDQ